MLSPDDREIILMQFADANPDYIEGILRALSSLGFKVNITVDPTGRAWADDFNVHTDGRNIHEALRRYVNKIS